MPVIATKSRRSLRAAKHASTELALVAFPTKLGWMAATFNGNCLARLTFGQPNKSAALAALGGKASKVVSAEVQACIELLTAFAAGEDVDLREIAVDYGVVTDFQRRVLDACREIEPGETLSYGELAVIVGAPGAARAVGNVMRTNRLPLVVPCHRVVGSGGGLGGYSAPDGLSMKRRLLEREGALVA